MMSEQLLRIKTQQNIDIVTNTNETTSADEGRKNYGKFERLTDTEKYIYGFLSKYFTDTKLELVNKNESQEPMDIVATVDDVTVVISVSSDIIPPSEETEKSLETKFQELHPDKFLLLQNSEIVLVEETLDDIWSKLPSYLIGANKGQLKILSPNTKIKMKTKLGWRIKRRR